MENVTEDVFLQIYVLAVYGYVINYAFLSAQTSAFYLIVSVYIKGCIKVLRDGLGG